MITTADERIGDEARIYRDQGKAGFLGGDHVRLGYAWRMSELHAAVGLVQLARLDEFIAVRRRIAHLYDAGTGRDPGHHAGAGPRGREPNYYKYLAVLDDGIDRAALKKALRERARVGDVRRGLRHPAPPPADLRRPPRRPLPVSEDVCARHVCLPVHNDMTDAEAEQVVDGLPGRTGPLTGGAGGRRRRVQRHGRSARWCVGADRCAGAQASSSARRSVLVTWKTRP